MNFETKNSHYVKSKVLSTYIFLVPYKVGDEVVFWHNVNSEADPFLEMMKGQIIALDTFMKGLLLVYIPHYQSVRVSFKVERKHMRDYGVNPKFMGEQAVFVQLEDIVKHLPQLDGAHCQNCGVFVEYAEPTNFRCRACKENPWR